MFRFRAFCRGMRFAGLGFGTRVGVKVKGLGFRVSEEGVWS